MISWIRLKSALLFFTIAKDSNSNCSVLNVFRDLFVNPKVVSTLVESYAVIASNANPATDIVHDKVGRQ